MKKILIITILGVVLLVSCVILYNKEASKLNEAYFEAIYGKDIYKLDSCLSKDTIIKINNIEYKYSDIRGKIEYGFNALDFSVKRVYYQNPNSLFNNEGKFNVKFVTYFSDEIYSGETQNLTFDTKCFLPDKIKYIDDESKLFEILCVQ